MKINCKKSITSSRFIFLFCIIFFSDNLLFSQQDIAKTRVDSSRISWFDKKNNGQHKLPDLFPSSSTTQFNNKGIPQQIQRTSAVINITVTITPSNCGGNNGSIVAQASGGTAPYTYNIGVNTTQNTGNFQGLFPRDYTLTVVDANGDTGTLTVTVTNTLSSPAITIGSYTNASTCYSNDASVTLNTLPGGLPPFEYSLDLVNFQTSPVFSNLYPGLYTFWIRDANGCVSAADTYSIGYLRSSSCPLGPGFNVYSTFSCNNDGFINLTPPGNNGPYTFSLDGINFQNVTTFTNLSYGVYNIFAKDVNGAVSVFALTLAENCAITVTYVSVDAACGQNDGSLTITASNGSAPYSYTLDGVNFQMSNTFTGLAPGNYTATVKDAGGKTSSTFSAVYDECPQIIATSTNATCPFNNNGTITTTGTKGTTPYFFSIDGVNFQANNTFSGLVSGNYTVTIMDAMGFTDTTPVTVGYSCINVTTTTFNSTCGNSNGSITVTANSGTGPYQYSRDGVNFQTANQFSGLLAGIYTITAKDVTGQTGSTVVTVQNTPGASVNAVVNPASCIGNDGTITISGTNGLLPYAYSIDGNNFQGNPTFNNLAAGSYTIWIKDGNSCLSSQAVNVLINCPIVTATVINETCNNSNGSITVVGTNGTPPYQFSIDGFNFQAGNIFSNLTAGNYIITIKDAAGTTNTTAVIVDHVCPVVTATVTNGLCGTANGLITTTGSNGTVPYQYSIDGVNFQTSNIFSNLASGTYAVTIKDVSGLTSTTIAEVNNYPGPVLSLSINPVSCINNNGEIILSSNVGTLPLQYSIDGTNFQANNIFNNLNSGNYTVFVKDANGCTDIKPAIVPTNNDLILNTGNDITICEGEKVTLTATSNGATFNWAPAATLNNAQILNPVASPIITTTYDVTALLGICTLSGSVVISVNPAPIASAGQDVTICYGKDVILNGTSGIENKWSPVTYLNDPAVQNPVVLKPQSSITYSLIVKDINGCQSLNDESVIVNVTPPAKVFAGNDTAIVLGQPFQLMAADINSSGFISYNWSPPFGLNNNAVKDPVATLTQEMKYTVTATTAADCEGSDEVIIKVYNGPEIYVPKAFTPNNDGLNDLLKAIPVGIKEFKYFKVFNRWGQEVFNTSDPAKGWDGKFIGKSQDVNNFVWIAEGIDEMGNRIVRKGSVIIIR